MIATPGEYAWFTERHSLGLAEAYSFIFVRGFTPEQLVARMGGRAEDFSWMTLDESIAAGDRYGYNTETVAVTSVGDWAFVAQYNSWLGADDEFIVPLSESTRLVSLYHLDLKGLEEFRWVEDGEIRFAFWAQDGFSEVPAELVETMERIDRDYECELYKGAGFALIEHLTGIKLTPQILEESAYLCGVIPTPPASG
ncbi:DUF6461 domain-containing protein [Bailinhaonella thermotolerans]|uniref:Uncharacterized protein n=1 Tax=Bailinhaonella thermotolerans TaxID=1070861 RepID=A0A3A4AUX3_9ACTN|nr:DUF6461 domain-containing protein [Bailinhaonella thermotolerans]RJL32075.1 hypothetical protein D5H75_16755 [Bailinhaonella thermotolerans]